MTINHRQPPITEKEVDQVLNSIREWWMYRLNQKGNGIFISSHEIAGVIDEEVIEMHDSLRDNQCLEPELMDIIVAAAHGVASIKTGRMDW